MSSCLVCIKQYLCHSVSDVFFGENEPKFTRRHWVWGCSEINQTKAVGLWVQTLVLTILTKWLRQLSTSAGYVYFMGRFESQKQRSFLHRNEIILQCLLQGLFHLGRGVLKSITRGRRWGVNWSITPGGTRRWYLRGVRARPRWPSVQHRGFPRVSLSGRNVIRGASHKV